MSLELLVIKKVELF